MNLIAPDEVSLKVLPYSIYGQSGDGTGFSAQNVLIDDPYDLGSRWSAGRFSSTAPTWLGLKLEKPSLIR